mmetsp:Transcript_30895/g.102180  ORF Transcript_30895/g.102180 Transcript_30895/m.102180 type:complete len:241 (+) Transcript_30895:233-955(+)
MGASVRRHPPARRHRLRVGQECLRSREGPRQYSRPAGRDRGACDGVRLRRGTSRLHSRARAAGRRDCICAGPGCAARGDGEQHSHRRGAAFRRGPCYRQDSGVGARRARAGRRALSHRRDSLGEIRARRVRNVPDPGGGAGVVGGQPRQGLAGLARRQPSRTHGRRLALQYAKRPTAHVPPPHRCRRSFTRVRARRVRGLAQARADPPGLAAREREQRPRERASRRAEGCTCLMRCAHAG